jgi:hypothetical protein
VLHLASEAAILALEVEDKFCTGTEVDLGCCGYKFLGREARAGRAAFTSEVQPLSQQPGKDM